ncbi:hypothetical protein [Nonomuraea sp. NPDC005501]|uniref:hypothetical protein n=1 Tax=Nonomuraea sp. NPDC005501 TaxID=3156884 RepID=UPI0033A47CD2
MTQECAAAGPAPGSVAAPEDGSDALLDALARGEPPPHDDPAARLLAVLRADTYDDEDGGAPEGGAGPVGQRRSSVSMTPST